MKKKRIRPFLLACLLLAVLLMVPATGLADAGGFAGDSDYGGGSDWGGSSDWGSDSDWGSSSGDGFVIWNGGGSGTGSGGGLIFWIIVVAVIYFVIRAKGKKSDSRFQTGRNISNGYPATWLPPESTTRTMQPPSSTGQGRTIPLPGKAFTKVRSTKHYEKVYRRTDQ